MQPGTPLTLGNQALRNGYYPQAIQHFCMALLVMPELGKTIAVSLGHARSKYLATRQGAEKQRVAVCGWELSHNAAGRVHTLAMLYQTFAEVEIIGSIFPRRGRQVWEPIRNTSIPIHAFVVEDESCFIEQAIALVAAHPFDLVHLSKPRAPNLFFGVLYKLIWNARVLIDIDDEELAFVGEETPISLDDCLNQPGQLPALKDLAGKNWTRLAVGLAKEFDGITVSNAALQLRYGGNIIRHARDEKLFQPLPDLKRTSRHKFGIPQDKKVVLFFGTPRAHKGLLEVAQTIAALQRNDLIFAVVGNFPDPAYQARLKAVAGENCIFIAGQPIESAPAVVAMADACLLMQDPANSAAQYQVPAKLGDALAMRVPVLGTETPALADAFMAGAILPVTPATIAAQLLLVLDGRYTATRLQDAGHRFFQNELSFAVNRRHLQQVSQQISESKTEPQVLNLAKRLAPALSSPSFTALLHMPTVPTVLNLVPPPAVLAVPKIALVVHVYYPELWLEIADRLQAISHPFDLFVTTTPEQAPHVIPLVTACFPKAMTKVQPNLGMDLLPFLDLIPTLIAQNYLAVCKLHTKKGDSDLAAHWRTAMLDALVGDNASFAAVAQAFASHPNLQIAGPAAHYQSVRRLMLNNEATLNALFLHLQGSPLPAIDWGFFAGTMFWVRPAALKKLADNQAYLQTRVEPNYQKDGQLVHALERLLGLLPIGHNGLVGLLHASTTAGSYTLQRIVASTHLGQASMGALSRQYAQLDTDLQKLADSGLFDHPHYLAQNPALAGHAIDLPSHYLLIGRFQSKTAHPDFDASFYARHHGPLLANGQDPLLHYLHKGAQASLQLRPSKAQETAEIPSFRYRALNAALIDWSAQASKPRHAGRVAIVIPVFNQPELTQACVAALYQHTPQARFELVLVDNGSDDATQQLLRQLANQHHNLHLVRNAENLNFALGCNLGFAVSQSEQVIFLNNDTTVTANWLEPLMSPLARPDISAVQPRLLYPDGTVQCMGVVFSDKSPLGYHIYAGLTPDESWAGRSRAFQAVTGACMALRAADFVQQKGFDPIYINGQEDIDLCLRMNSKNRMSWYAATSSVFHFESKTRGRRDNIFFNRKIYVERWREIVKSDDVLNYMNDNLKASDWYSDCSSNEIALQRPRKIIKLI